MPINTGAGRDVLPPPPPLLGGGGTQHDLVEVIPVAVACTGGPDTESARARSGVGRIETLLLMGARFDVAILPNLGPDSILVAQVLDADLESEALVRIDEDARVGLGAGDRRALARDLEVGVPGATSQAVVAVGEGVGAVGRDPDAGATLGGAHLAAHGIVLEGEALCHEVGMNIRVRGVRVEGAGSVRGDDIEE